MRGTVAALSLLLVADASAAQVAPFDMSPERATLPAPEKTEPVAFRPRQPDAPAARRHLLALTDPRLVGEQATRSWSVYLTAAETAGATLDLGFASSIFVAPEASRLRLAINGTPVLDTPIRAAGAPAALSAPLPPGVLRPGPNVFALEVQQRHRTDCTVSSTYDLWTELDPAAPSSPSPTSTPPRPTGRWSAPRVPWLARRTKKDPTYRPRVDASVGTRRCARRQHLDRAHRAHAAAPLGWHLLPGRAEGLVGHWRPARSDAKGSDTPFVVRAAVAVATQPGRSPARGWRRTHRRRRQHRIRHPSPRPGAVERRGGRCGSPATPDDMKRLNEGFDAVPDAVDALLLAWASYRQGAAARGGTLVPKRRRTRRHRRGRLGLARSRSTKVPRRGGRHDRPRLVATEKRSRSISQRRPTSLPVESRLRRRPATPRRSKVLRSSTGWIAGR